MYKIIITWFLLWSAISPECLDGCLKCGIDSNCQLCNFHQAFILQGGSCVRQVDMKCMIAGYQGECYICSSSYYLDKSQKKCLPLNNYIENCEYHLNDTACLQCNHGYYQSQGKCLPVVKQIPHCKVYQDAGKCLVCEYPHDLSSDYTQCNVETDIDNCLMQSNFYCDECREGYFRNKNNYIHTLFHTQSLHPNTVSFLQALYFNREINVFPDPCEKIILNNCKTAESAVRCQTCENGYWLNSDGICVKNPYLIIDNCFIYQYHNKCQQCNGGYYLDDGQTLCVKHPDEIKDCKEYSQTAMGQCQSCQEGFYLTQNTCSPRVQSLNMEGCLLVSLNEDSCAQCLPKYQLTSDKLKCLEKITNCTSYASSSMQQQSLVCQSCNNNTYLESVQNLCLQGPVENCDIYSNPTTCQSCQNKFYLDSVNNVCKVHVTIPQCLTYSQNSKDQCTQCVSSHFLFQVENYCLQAKTIEHCVYYTSETECQECEEGWFVFQNTSCVLIPEDQNCLRRTNTQCTKCKSGYFLNGSNNCQKFYDYQRDRCKTPGPLTNYSTPHVNGVSCNVCLARYFFKDFTNKYVCLKQTDFPTGNYIIDHCKIIHRTAQKLECKKCDTGFYLQVNGSNANDQCNNTCQSSYFPIIYDINSAGTSNGYLKFQLQNMRINECINPPAGDDPLVYSLQLDDVSVGQCKSSHVSEYEYSSTSFDITRNVFSYGYSYPIFGSCRSKAQLATFYPSPSESSQHCESYKIVNNISNNFYCVTCKFGYSGKVIKQDNEYYQSCDVKIAGCSSDFYGGFNTTRKAYLNQNLLPEVFYSCHKCEQNKIPFFHASLDANKKIKSTSHESIRPFSIQNIGIPLVDNGSDNTIQCLTPTASSFNIDSNKFTKTFPKNCGLGLFDTSVTKAYDSNNQSLYCIECDSGYRKVYDINNQFVIQCVPISFCNENRSDHWFSSCANCLTGYAWKFDTTKGYIYDECHPTTLQNCLVVDFGQNTQTCKHCFKGFDNINGKCEKFYVPRCKNYVDNTQIVYASSAQQIENSFWLVAYLQQNVDEGCGECDEGYISYNNPPSDTKACVSSYTAQNFIQSSLFNLIPYCLYYSGLAMKCVECQNDYILNDSGSQCYKRSLYPNCVVINQQDKCVKCDPDYYPMDGKCLKGKIENCTSYTLENQTQKCQGCIDGYRPSFDKISCVKGQLGDCKSYANTQFSSCTACVDSNFTPLIHLNTTDEQGYCFYPLQEPNCEQVSKPNDANKNQNYSCSKCKPGYYKTTDTTKYLQQICVPTRSITNCLEYDLSTGYFTSSHKCLKCADGYYVSRYGYECKLRTVVIDNCGVMNPLNQKCQSCNLVYYLNLDKTQCLPNPTGVKHCIKYSSMTTCEKCEVNYYLLDNICNKVTTQNLILNCDFYNSQQQCDQCNSNFVLDGGVCVAPTAQNCITYAAVNQCKTCPDSYQLVKDEANNLLNCVYKNINNCSKIDQNTGLCIRCQNNSFVDSNGNCAAATFIQYCEKYDSKDTCEQCDEDHYLSVYRTTCEIKGLNVLLDLENCIDIRYQTEKTCSVCESGYYFENDICVPCSTEEGCFVCNPRDPTVCLICEDGYHQLSYNGECAKSEILEFPDIQALEDENWTMIYQIGTLLLVLFI